MSAAPAVIRGETSVSWHNRRSVSDVAPRLAVATPAVVLVAAGDPRSSRIVYAMVVGLVVIGVALVLLGVWLVRQTRPDLEVLAPLERMGDGDWKKRDPSTQRRMLDEVRPEGAQPLTPEPKPPPIDAEFEADHPVASFSDLGPGLAAEHRDPTPVAADQLDTDTDVDVDDAEAEAEVDIDSGDTENDEAEAQSDPGPVDSDAENLSAAGDEPAERDGEEGADSDAEKVDDVDDVDDEALSDPRG
jgi:FtsZ-interacting cell division protein ZipA